MDGKDEAMQECEGRCGSRLLDGRERDQVHRPKPDDWAPLHTPERCRVIRQIREAVKDRCPKATVAIYPASHATETMFVYSEVIVAGTRFSRGIFLRDSVEDANLGSFVNMRQADEAGHSLMNLVASSSS